MALNGGSSGWCAAGTQTHQLPFLSLQRAPLSPLGQKLLGAGVCEQHWLIEPETCLAFFQRRTGCRKTIIAVSPWQTGDVKDRPKQAYLAHSFTIVSSISQMEKVRLRSQYQLLSTFYVIFVASLLSQESRSFWRQCQDHEEGVSTPPEG